MSAENNQGNKTSPGYFGWCEIIQNPLLRFVPIALVALVLSLVPTILSGCHASTEKSVVIYTSQDEEYADPIFKAFQEKTGITVKPVYDSEAVKTVGLVNRLLAEKSNPQCDVFWNNEELRTRLLASQNIFRETNGWVLMGYRTRRIAINTNLLSYDKAPKKFQDATNEIWRGKVALAYPMFGTTATHFLALRQAWGDKQWQAWCRALVANKPFLVDGNSVAAKQVGGGEALVAFTDSDDVASEQREGLPLGTMPIAEDSLILHNTAGVIRGSPHPEEAQILFDYIQSAEVQNQLVAKHALQSATPADPKTQPGLRVNWDDLLRDLDKGTDEMREIFLR